MTYQTGGKVEANDIETLQNLIDDVLADKGQSQVPQYIPGTTVLASHWATLINYTANLAAYQGTNVTSINAPTPGSTESYVSSLTTNISNVITNKRNAASQGTAITLTTTNSAQWATSTTFTQTVSFATVQAAQTFFNCGGQIGVYYTHPAGTGIDGVFNALAKSCGTLTISSASVGAVSIGGKAFSGLQRENWGGDNSTAPTGTGVPHITTAGYYGLTNTTQTVFKLLGGNYTNPVPGGGTYSQNYIQLNAYVSAGGATINLVSTWSEAATGGLKTAGGSACVLVVRPPATTNGITNTWGTPTLAGSVV
jgi:hypothetical protein